MLSLIWFLHATVPRELGQVSKCRYQTLCADYFKPSALLLLRVGLAGTHSSEQGLLRVVSTSTREGLDASPDVYGPVPCPPCGLLSQHANHVYQ